MSEDKFPMTDSKYYEMMKNLSESIFDYSNSKEPPIELPIISGRGARKKLTLEERTRRLRMIRLFIYEHEPEAKDYFQALDEQIDANEKEIAFYKLYDPFFRKLFSEAMPVDKANLEEGD